MVLSNFATYNFGQNSPCKQKNVILCSDFTYMYMLVPNVLRAANLDEVTCTVHVGQ